MIVDSSLCSCVHHVFIACALVVRYLFTICSRSVYYLFTICSRFVYHVFISLTFCSVLITYYSLLVRFLFTSCSHLVHLPTCVSLLCTFWQFAFTMFHLLVTCCSTVFIVCSLFHLCSLLYACSCIFRLSSRAGVAPFDSSECDVGGLASAWAGQSEKTHCFARRAEKGATHNRAWWGGALVGTRGGTLSIALQALQETGMNPS